MAASTGHFDVGAQRVGTLYAKALLGAAQTTDTIDTLLAELGAIVDDVLDKHPKLDRVFSTVMVSPAEKIAMLDRLFARRLSPLMLNFLKVVAQHERLGFLRAIRTEAHELSNEMKGRVRVELTTAVPLSSAAAGDIAQQLRTLLRREPALVTLIDARLLGGIQMRVGDTVYDGSVATRLRRLRVQLRQRNLQEIETAREKFLTTNGT